MRCSMDSLHLFAIRMPGRPADPRGGVEAPSGQRFAPQQRANESVSARLGKSLAAS